MISFDRVTKQYGRQVLFVEASFQLNPGEKVGLVGPNGSGKTTLFRMIMGEEAPDEGDVSVPKRTMSIEVKTRRDASIGRSSPNASPCTTNSVPVTISTSGYCQEMRVPQFRQRPPRIR